MQLNTKKCDAFVGTFSVMRAGVRLIVIKEVRNYRKFVCIKNIFENGWWEDMLCLPLILPPGSAPGHKLQKPSKEFGIF